MNVVQCARCHNVVRHGRARGFVVAFCSCLARDKRQKLMEILRNVEEAVEVPHGV